MDNKYIITKNMYSNKEYKVSPIRFVKDLAQSNCDQSGTIERMENEIEQLEEIIGNLLEILITKNIVGISDLNFLCSGRWDLQLSVNADRIIEE